MNLLLKPFPKHSRDAGMTIIEILIVIALMSTIMAVLVTKLLDKSDAAKADLTGLLESKLNDELTIFKLDTGRFPATEEGLQALVEAPAAVRNWKGPYVSTEKLQDPWGVALQYERITARAFKITSAGSDGEFGTDDDVIYPKEASKPAEETPVTAELRVPTDTPSHTAKSGE